ncbi:thioesterase family protein [Annulohypoxylon truncatum]|uniref:thioesterase family protein n=1 Tax=Annulohypoxylon truncatum TaxID=327061 RepID=UPI00200762BC|nr:thioesterase family protein [Annulohypoxylon truncatum]KAI1204949.1 thioesterase family protein [Annulohypoxylon truncatum]
MMTSNKPKDGFFTFSQATKIEKLDSHTYRANLNETFCIGAVPNGGYAGSCMLAAARAHLSSRNQPDTLTAHFEFPGRTAVGPAIIVIDDVKLSRQLSTVHVTLWQGALLPNAPWITPSVSRRVVLAYATNINFGAFAGMSLPTGYEGTPAAALPPVPDFEALKSKGADGTWEETKVPEAVAAVQRSLLNWRFYEPCQGPLAPGVLDMWICSASGERVTQGALAYVVDSFPVNLHTFLAAPELRALLEASQKGSTDAKAEEVRERDQQRATLWFPTVVMNLEVKKLLPEEGAEWLAVRVTSKQIRDGKFDLEVLVRDVEGEIVALSHHVAMIVSLERNTGKKGSPKPAL